MKAQHMAGLRTSLLLIALSIASMSIVGCSRGLHIEFKGEDVSDPDGFFSLTVDREADRLRVVSRKHGFELSLPYAEDWDFDVLTREAEANGDMIFSGRSSFGPAAVFVSLFDSHDQSVDPETYLRKTSLREYQSLPDGGPQRVLREPVFEEIDGNLVLDYISVKYRWAGLYFPKRELASCYFIVVSLRQKGTGPLYRLHFLSHVEPEDLSKPPEVRSVLREIVGKTFRIVSK